jgi:hypothetical protein
MAYFSLMKGNRLQVLCLKLSGCAYIEQKFKLFTCRTKLQPHLHFLGYHSARKEERELETAFWYKKINKRKFRRNHNSPYLSNENKNKQEGTHIRPKMYV